MQDLVGAAVTGGAAEADALIRAVWPRAYRIALSVLRDHALAEDAAQESCAILFRKVGWLKSVAAFRVWFYKIVLREAVALRKRTLRQKDALAVNSLDLDAAVTRIDISNALSRLPRMQRDCTALHYYADLSSKEIGLILKIPDSSVRFHIMRAKKTLRETLRQEINAA